MKALSPEAALEWLEAAPSLAVIAGDGLPEHPGLSALARMLAERPTSGAVDLDVQSSLRRAGFSPLVELRGSLDRLECEVCQANWSTSEALEACPACGGSCSPSLVPAGGVVSPRRRLEAEFIASRPRCLLALGLSAGGPGERLLSGAGEVGVERLSAGPTSLDGVPSVEGGLPALFEALARRD